MNTTRNGKIARLAHEQQELVNQCLRQNRSTAWLLEHLNGLPEVQDMLYREFNSEPITKHNLSAWRRGGYKEWEVRQEWRLDAKELKDFSVEVHVDGGPDLVERLTFVLAGRYASIMLKWDGKPDEKVEERLKLLGRLSRDVLALQRGQQREARLKLVRAKHQWDEMRFTQQLGGWIVEHKAALAAREEVAPVILESVKTLMHNVGLDYDWLKAKAAKRKEREEGVKSEGRNQKSERNPKSKGGGAKGTAGQKERPTSNEKQTIPGSAQEGEHRTPEGQHETWNLKPETPVTEVVEDEGASRSVKVSKGFESDEGRGEKCEGKPNVPIVPEPKVEEGGMMN